MAKKIKIKSSKTYATEANCDKAVERLYGDTNVMYFVALDEAGRYYPIFIGQSSVTQGVFFHYPCVG